MGLIDGITKAVKGRVNKAINAANVYDMRTREARERRVKADYEYAKVQKQPQTEKFIEYDNYYHNEHYSKQQMLELKEKMGWKFIPPVLPDPYIQVESQIDNDIPAFQFKGRDDDLDSQKAKLRQKVVEFIIYNNRLEAMNGDNERNLGKLGNAFWKLSFDKSITGPGYIGDIVIGNPDPANIFPDPSAYEIDDCEYIMYVYRIHRRKARRKWGKIIDELSDDSSHYETEIYESSDRSVDDETLQVIEYWYRDDDGDIACSITVGGREVQHIPKFWADTRMSGNQKYPFVKYCRIPVSKSFWDKSEIATIKDLVDAADREFFYAILNDMFTGNDIVLREKNAFAEDMPPVLPGAVWDLQDGKINSVKRLGGVSNNTNIMNMVKFIHDKIEETNGNFATKGTEPTRVTTASGLAQLREDRDQRQSIKKADRKEGFHRLYELCDWMALEFYNTSREILIRGKNEGEQDEVFTFNRDMVAQTGDDGATYFPRIDCEIITGDGIRHSKAFTLAATQELLTIASGIQPENAPIVVPIIVSIIDILDLPNKKEVKEAVLSVLQQGGQPGAQQGADIAGFANSLPPEMQQIIAQMGPEQGQAVLNDLMTLPAEQIPDYMNALLGGGRIGPEAQTGDGEAV